MHYRIIAIDLDGTLLDHQGRVSKANLNAIVRAQAAGTMVVPCTGRAWRESRAALRQLPIDGHGVFVTGAVVSETTTGRSLDIALIEPHLTLELVRFLEHLPEAVLVCRESQQVGHDYLVTGRGSLTANTQWWFESTGATVHFQQDLTADDLHHTLRVGIVADGARVPTICEQLEQAFSTRISTHSFPAVNLPDPTQSIYVLEVFASGVDKWRGLQWVAHQTSTPADQIAAIGDQVNDLAMIRSAGCGIAMTNASQPVKDAADHITLSCDQDGVAHAIDQLLAGNWKI